METAPENTALNMSPVTSMAFDTRSRSSSRKTSFRVEGQSCHCHGLRQSGKLWSVASPAGKVTNEITTNDRPYEDLSSAPDTCLGFYPG